MARPFFFGGNQSSQQSQYLVQMKAGKMVKNGNTVSPIKERKGLVYLHQSADDNLMHFCWKDRTSGQLEDDLIMFPDDAEFLKVPQCTTGRVFVLKFKTSSRRLFFWSQEPKDDKDDEIVSKINEYINNPMAATNAANRNSGTGVGSGGVGGGSGGGLMSPGDLGLGSEEEFRNLFSNANVSAQQLMSMLDAGLAVLPPGASRLASLLGSVQQNSSNNSGGVGTTPTRIGNNSIMQPVPPISSTQTPNTTPALTSSATSNTTTGGNNSPASTNIQTPTGLQLSDLQNIISGLSTPGDSNQSDNDLNVDLSTSINVEVLRPLLTNEDFMKRIGDMLPQSTASSDSSSATKTTTVKPLSEQFLSTVQSPQFQQALNSFSHALQSGQLGPLIQQFGLPESCVTAANKGNFEEFIKGLQGKKDSTQDSKEKKKDEKTTGKKEDQKDGGKKDKKDEKFDDDSMALD
ncbi:regulatory particle non-ATPase 13 [Dermatophagoides pteronyssinus]|uniref:regulatory particle non-ATPase 13 n=1 Tax=Dermatophagoides pteronyssinus TaxID=6956 RepID=UPI003F67FB26